MSYDTSIRCKHCDNSLGGYSDNYTYNLSNMFDWALDRDFSDLEGMSGKKAAKLLSKAIERCNKDKNLKRFNPANNWGDSESALLFLCRLYEACLEHPKGIVRIY